MYRSEELCSTQLWSFLWSLNLHIRSNFCGTNFLYWSQGLKMPPSSANISNSAATLENFGTFKGDAVWILKWLAWGPSVVFDTEIDPDDMGYNAVLQHQWVILSSNWSPPPTCGLMKYSELQYLWNLTFQSWLDISLMHTSSVYPHGYFLWPCFYTCSFANHVSNFDSIIHVLPGMALHKQIRGIWPHGCKISRVIGEIIMCKIVAPQIISKLTKPWKELTT